MRLLLHKKAHVSLRFIRRTGPSLSSTMKASSMMTTTSKSSKMKASSMTTTPSKSSETKSKSTTSQRSDWVRKLGLIFTLLQVQGCRPIRSGNWDWSSPTTSPRSQADWVWKFGQDQLPGETVRISQLYEAKSLNKLIKGKCLFIYWRIYFHRNFI